MPLCHLTASIDIIVYEIEFGSVFVNLSKETIVKKTSMINENHKKFKILSINHPQRVHLTLMTATAPFMR